jgi:hypothetical protein
MADLGIKKYRQKYVDLPPISAETQGYSVRYRIISEDRNRTSHWSPVYLVVPDYVYVPGNIEVQSANQVINFTWDPVTILKTNSSNNDIINKSLTNDLATLTTSDAHYMNVGDWVTVEGVDATFNGTYKINAITNNTFSYYKDNGNVALTPVSPAGIRKTNSFVGLASTYDIWLKWDKDDGGDWTYKERIFTTSVSYPHSAFYTIDDEVQSQPPNKVMSEIYLIGNPISRKAVDITNVSASSGVITYTAENNFTAGDIVSITGVLPSNFNLSNQNIVTASSTGFTISSGQTGIYVSGGKATIPTSSFLKVYQSEIHSI